jgi:hypothetical protein
MTQIEIMAQEMEFVVRQGDGSPPVTDEMFREFCAALEVTMEHGWPLDEVIEQHRGRGRERTRQTAAVISVGPASGPDTFDAEITSKNGEIIVWWIEPHNP